MSPTKTCLLHCVWVEWGGVCQNANGQNPFAALVETREPIFVWVGWDGLYQNANGQNPFAALVETRELFLFGWGEVYQNANGHLRNPGNHEVWIFRFL